MQQPPGTPSPSPPPPPALPPLPPLTDIKSNRNTFYGKRQFIANEILCSERTYLSNLTDIERVRNNTLYVNY